MTFRMQRKGPPVEKRRLGRALRIGIVTVGSLVVLALGFSAVYAGLYHGRILPGVRFGTTDLGGLTYQQAEKQITDNLASFWRSPIQVRSGGRVWRSSLNDLGVGYDIVATLENAKRIGRGRHLIDTVITPVYAFSRGDIVQPALVVQSRPLDEFIVKVAKEVDQPAIEPHITLTSGTVTIAPGKTGQIIDQDALHALLADHLQRLDTQQIDAPIMADGPLGSAEQLRALQQQAQKILVAPFKLTSGEQTFEIPIAELTTWLAITNDGRNDVKLGLDRKTVEASLAEHCSEVVIDQEDQVTYRTLQPTKPIVEGRDGQRIDIDKTLQTIADRWIEKRRDTAPLAVTVIPRHVQELSVTPVHTTGKSILTDLTRQTVFAFQDGQLLFFALASTGKYPRATPTGEFHVYSKSRRQKMSGPGYYLPNVQWVMFYNGDYSLHGTYWHNNFGHPMSHGCSNLSNESAERFYDFGEVGTPVTIIGETPRS